MIIILHPILHKLVFMRISVSL